MEALIPESQPDKSQKTWASNAIWCMLGTLFATSAYNVYCNELRSLPVGVNFFWFSFFATATLFLVYPKTSWKPLKRGGLTYPAVASLGYFLYFFFLLKSLSLKEDATLITILVIMQLGPMLHVLVGIRFFKKDTCKWKPYIVGTIIAFLGVMIYEGINPLKYFLSASSSDWTMGILTKYMLAVLAFDCIWLIARRSHEEEKGIKAEETIKVVQVAGVLIGLVWVAIIGKCWPDTLRQWIALIYLGAVPTAFGFTITNQTQKPLGIPIYRSIGNLRPVMAIMIGYVYTFLSPLADPIKLQSHNMAGIIMTITGTLIAMLLGKPKEYKPPEDAPKTKTV